jgi:hypothetical protein
VKRLNDAPLTKRSADVWLGSFEGAIAIENIVDHEGLLRFDLMLPTSEYDIDDFILRSERESGTTNKVVLLQNGEPLEGA